MLLLLPRGRRLGSLKNTIVSPAISPFRISRRFCRSHVQLVGFFTHRNPIFDAELSGVFDVRAATR